MGNAEVAEGEGRWSVPVSAALGRGDDVSGEGIEGSSSMSSPEKEKLNADILRTDAGGVMTRLAREVGVSRAVKAERGSFSEKPSSMVLKLQCN